MMLCMAQDDAVSGARHDRPSQYPWLRQLVLDAMAQQRATLATLSTRAGVAVGTIQKLRHGRYVRDAETRRVLDALGIPTSVLSEGVDSAPRGRRPASVVERGRVDRAHPGARRTGTGRPRRGGPACPRAPRSLRAVGAPRCVEG